MAALVIPFLASTAAAVIGGATIGAALIGSAIIVGGGYLLARRNRPRGGLSQSLDVRQNFRQNPNPPRRIIYGRARFSPTLLHATSPENFAGVRLGMVLADHGLRFLRGVYLNNELFVTPETAPNIHNPGSRDDEGNLTGTFGEVITTSTPGLPEGIRTAIENQDRAGRFSSGTFATVYVGLDAENPGDSQRFTRLSRQGIPRGLDLRYSGASTMYLRLSGDTIWDSVPNVAVDVDRRDEDLLLPPGFNNSWNRENAAMCAYDYLMKYTAYGQTVFGTPLIDIDSVLQAAQECHDNGFWANGVLFLTDEPTAVLDQFALAMGGGMFIERAGIMHFRTGVDATSAPPVILYRGEQASAEWSVNPAGDPSTRPTTIEVVYTSVDGQQQSVIAGVESASPSRIETIEAALINNERQARIAAEATLVARRVDRVTTIRYILTPDSPEWLLRLEVGDIVSIPRCLTQEPSDTNPGERHRIAEIELNPDGTRIIRAARFERETP